MVHVACYADEDLLVNLGIDKKIIQHQEGKGNVLNHLRDSKGNSMGMIDEDPESNQPRELQNYELLQSLSSVSFFKHRDYKNKYLQMIKPVLETWLIERAEANKISLKKYNLPVKRKEVHNVKRYDLNNNYQKFLSQLIEQDNEIKVVQEWLKKKNFIK